MSDSPRPDRRCAVVHDRRPVVIVVNAVALGLETYDGIADRFGDDARRRQRRLPRDLRRRARAPDRRVRAPAVGLLPQRLERVRLRRHRDRVRPGHPRVVDAAAARPARARRAHRPALPRPPRAARRRLAEHPAALRDRPRDRDAPLRLRDGRLDALRGRAAGRLGEHRPGDAHALRDADARELPRLHGRGDGGAPVVVGLLRELHPDRRVRRHQRPDRDRAQLDGGGARGGAPARGSRAARRRAHRARSTPTRARRSSSGSGFSARRSTSSRPSSPQARARTPGRRGVSIAVMRPPVLLAVDVDADGLRDVERELDDRYARHYEILCLSSAAEARARLEALAGEERGRARARRTELGRRRASRSSPRRGASTRTRSARC